MAHSHHHHHSDQMTLSRLRLVFALNFSFTLLELVGGLLTGSMAIVADAVHDLGDTFSLGLALIFEQKARGLATPNWTYGYKRLSLLSALISSMILIMGSFLVIFEVGKRIFTGEITAPHGLGMLLLAVVGTAVNGFAAFRLHGGQTQNEKVLSLHLLEDFLGWLAVLVGAVIYYFTEWVFIDLLLAGGISAFILWNVAKSLRETLKIFLQYIPSHVSLEEIEQELLQINGLEGIRHDHAWSLDGEDHVFTAQIIVKDAKRAQGVKEEIRSYLRAKGFRHITIEVIEGEEDGHCHPLKSDAG